MVQRWKPSTTLALWNLSCTAHHCTMTPATNPFEHSPCRQSLRIHAHSIIFWHSNYLILVHLRFPWHKWFLLVLRPLPLNRCLLLTFAILMNRFRFYSTDGSRLQGCLALVPPCNAFGFQPPADQFSNPNSAEEMLVRKSTNGETWVQHVLEGLTSNFESITVIIAVKHCAKPGSLAYAELRRQTSTTGLQWHEWSSYCYNHPRPRHAAGGQTGTLTQVDSLHEVLLLYFSSDQFWIALRDVSCS